MKKNLVPYLVGFLVYHALAALVVNLLGFGNQIKYALLGVMRMLPFVEGLLNEAIAILGLVGYFGTLWILYLISILSLGLGLIVYLCTYVIAKFFVYPIPKQYEVEDMAEGYGEGQTPGVRITFVSPEVAQTPQTEYRAPVAFDWPIRRLYMKLRGQDDFADDINDPVDRLKLAGMGILKSHGETPAALSGHHAGETLLGHTKQVVLNIRKYSDDRLADVAALFHDMGKVKAYKKGKNGKWKRDFYNHSVLAFTMVSKMPDYEKLSKNDQDTLRDVLTYFYRDRLPTYLDGNTRVLALIKALKKADSMATNEEISQTTESETSIGLNARTLLDTIGNLNINGNVEPGNPAGWFFKNANYMFINPNELFEALRKVLPPEEAASLQLDINIMNNPDHTGLAALSSTLKAMGIFVTEVQGVTSESGLFDLKVGRLTFRKIMAIEVEDVRNQIDVATIQSWGDFQHPWTGTKAATYT